MTAYYNEFDPYAAQWLRNLIKAGHIAPGEVDDRSISDVTPDDLTGFTQCHFFAGIGGWSLALRLAGWGDDMPVWTGSCPCQPFSVAGAGGGMRDERHLWPDWFWLIEQRRPAVVFGEQVDAAIRHAWLDLVQSDMEGIGYAFAPVGVPAAGVGAPHIRQRLWFVGHTDDAGLEGLGRGHQTPSGRVGEVRPATQAGKPSGLADNQLQQRPHRQSRIGVEHEAFGRQQDSTAATGLCSVEQLANTDNERRNRKHAHLLRQDPYRGKQSLLEATRGGQVSGRENAVNGFWCDADWIPCRDGKWRPVEPGTFPLAHGVPSRVGRLRAYGNAIVPQVAAEVIRTFMAYRP